MQTLSQSNAPSIGIALLLILASQQSVYPQETDEKWAQWKETYDSKVLAIMQAKCLKCHEGDKAEGEFDLAKFTTGQRAAESMDDWERVAKRIRLNEMPPKGSPPLRDKEKSTFQKWIDARPNQDLCNQLASDETQSWFRGNVMSRRLTQVEYANAVRDLTGVELLPGEEPPADGAGGEGFDTVGDALFISTIHLEKYLTTARAVVGRMMEQPEWKDAPVHPSLERFARRAWRRPVRNEEVHRLERLISGARGLGFSEREALAEGMQAIMVSPHFLFVVETEPNLHGVQRLSPHQLVNRLSLMIWSSIPDEELLRCADDKSIYDSQVLRHQVARMVQDSRARALGENFGIQWLGLRNNQSIAPDPELFPEYAGPLASDMREEAVRFVAHVFQHDRPLTDLIDANYAIWNSRLAAFYGHKGGVSDDWNQVALSTRDRGGVVTMASVLTATSYPRRTSPVLRGKWLLEQVLGSNIPAPPPNVPTLDEVEISPMVKTVRQRLEIHRQRTECASCHDSMDPLGFGLENYDPIGRWRREEAGEPIDASGSLPGGEKFETPSQLKDIVLKRKDEFLKHFVAKFLGFTLGRELNKFDRCIVDEIVAKLGTEGYRAQLLLEQVALSHPFQHRFILSESRAKAAQFRNQLKEWSKKVGQQFQQALAH